MNLNHDIMTVQECCMFVAQENGWTYHKSARVWTHKDDNAASIKLFCAGLLPDRGDPFPATLDSAAAAMPERWCFSLERYETGYTISAHSWDMTKTVPTFEADTELLARWRLVVACMMAEKEGSNG